MKIPIMEVILATITFGTLLAVFMQDVFKTKEEKKPEYTAKIYKEK